eukprot:TRINITY_DN4043_c1_g2_i2.p1 TRINITY_DN4043_c1_g2~~TRINITY_DN4043_c1_g2_i2.p1  ORF type:complete len:186 (+),score=26.52 TRINITY_DN4043_c1_g2_i2:74-631(+)
MAFVPMRHSAVKLDVSEEGTAGLGNKIFGGLAGVDSRFQDILVSVASHYESCLCVLALRHSESLHVVAVCSKGHRMFEEDIRLIDEEKFQLFHHHIRRSLPTIIYNAADDKRTKSDPCVVGKPHVRFYAAAPILSSNQECYGTLCIVDSEPKSCFALDEADYLCDQATAVASLIQSGAEDKSCET